MLHFFETMSAVSVRRDLNDNVGSGEDVNMSCVMENLFISHQDRVHQTKKEPFASLLPPRHSSSLSPVCHPSDQVYLQAAAVFQQLRTEKPVTRQLLQYEKKTDTPLPESGDKPSQKKAYQLAFSTLKYQDLLENIITDSCFHTSQHIERRFVLCERTTREGQEAVQEVRDLERSLQRCKTKLAASLARCRVKQNLQSVSCFLSDPVRTKQRRAKCLPVYAWVNTLTTSLEDVCEALQSTSLCEAATMTDLKESTFCKDPLCPDTLIFSRHLPALHQHSSFTTAHVLNIQDRSVCVAVSVLRPLLFDRGDVLVVGSFSAVTVAHVAVAAADRAGLVLVCGADRTPSQVEEIQELLTRMDIGNVRVLSEAFCGLNELNATIHRLKVILVLPQCSSSALNDPVPTIHSEHGDWDVLPDLSHGSVSKTKIHSLTTQQARLLAKALTFPKVQTVVYCTRSVYPEENEQLVKRVLEKTHTHPKLLPFRVNGPIFPDDSPSGDTTDSKFFMLKPSQFTNGCFIARLSRQADPTKVETIQDVLARAAAKGLLGGIMPEQSKTGKKGKSKKNRAASATSKPSTSSSPERQTGGELGNEGDPEQEGEKGEGDFKESEDEEGKVGGKGGKKKRGLKGRKRKVKQNPKLTKKTDTVSTQQPKSHKKNATKRKVTSHHKRRSKPRRIPRLTLTLISSAKSSNHFSPIAALAHKLSLKPAIKSQQTVLSSPSGNHASPARPAPPVASKTQNTQPGRAEKKQTDTTKPARNMIGPENVVATQEVLKAADFALPPISSPSSGSPHSKTGSSVSRPPSLSSKPQLLNMSASSSSVSLPGL